MVTDSRWRHRANQIIALVVKENPNLSEHELRKKLSDAYPFGERKNHPYKIWLSAVNGYLDPRTTRHKTKVSVANGNQLPLSMDDEGESK
jgi:hypothetical protein